ncbi:hypothetical protein [Haladaptatus cibarius]|nr:hypothetical protein [Haladaptatus cibarius]
MTFGRRSVVLMTVFLLTAGSGVAFATTVMSKTQMAQYRAFLMM